MPNPSTGSPLHDVARRIRDLIAAGDLTETLDQLRNLALNGPSDLADDAILLAAQHARLVRAERKRVVTDEQVRVERTRIENSALGLLRELERTLTRAAVPVPAPVARAATFSGAEAVGTEKIIGVNNVKQIAWLEQGLGASRAVCRVLTPAGLGTGFLIGPRVLMTNHHVIGSATLASQAKAEFNYQLPFGAAAKPLSAVRYEFDPAALFRTSAALDYTVVAVKPGTGPDTPPVESWGRLLLNPDADPMPNEHVVIVQHPNGGPKQIVLTANAVLQVKQPYLYYSTDTMSGSSGSPVFNDLWQVIAIHHAAGPSVAVHGGIRNSNEGVLMSAIRSDLGVNWPN